MTIALLRGRLREIASYSKGVWKCLITETTALGNGIPPRGQIFCFKEGDHHPVPAGWWMDWPESHWEISKAEYNRLPEKERALLECKEQIPKEYDRLREEFYQPEEHERKWWSKK
jgi:hypothetical protein